MSTVTTARPSGPDEPAAVSRHGVCRLKLLICSNVYTIKRLAPVKVGAHVARGWSVRQVLGPRVGAVYAVTRLDGTITCTCPDMCKNNPVACKHIGALVAAGLLARPRSRSNRRGVRP